MYKKSVARGNGTEEQRAHVREMIRTADEQNGHLMKEFLKLSTKHKLVFAHNSGRFAQLDRAGDHCQWCEEGAGALVSSSG